MTGFGQVTPDIQKAMHMSPPCISTGVLKNHVFTSLLVAFYLALKSRSKVWVKVGVKVECLAQSTLGARLVECSKRQFTLKFGVKGDHYQSGVCLFVCYQGCVCVY